jgi:hypothetical protein
VIVTIIQTPLSQDAQRRETGDFGRIVTKGKIQEDIIRFRRVK